MSKKRGSKARRAKKSRALVIKIAAVVLLFAIAGGSIVGFMNYSEVQKMKGVINIDTIYKNIFINNVDVGGLTEAEANKKLSEAFLPDIQSKKISIVAEHETMELKFSELGVGLDFTEAVTEAYSYARKGTPKERYEQIIQLETTPNKITYEPKYSYDDSGVQSKIDSFAEKVYVAPKEPTIGRSNGKFFTTPGENGAKLNVDETLKQALVLIAENKEGEVAAVMDPVEPEFTEENFKDAQSLIGTYSSSFSPGENGRNTNIKTAASKLNDVVLYPDEIFSTNAAFGAMTYENGYREASVIVGGKLEDDFGGGVCQVSSTLYNALLLAELNIVERQNHSMKVGYMDYGFDATLAGDYIDLKFKNDTKYPVFIESYIQNGSKVVVNIYGHEVHGPGRKLAFQSALVETVPPGAEQVEEDPTLPAGERVVVTGAKTGYKYSVYKIIYENNKEVEKVHVNNSYYKPVRATIKVGTGTGVAADTGGAANVNDAPAADNVSPVTPPATQEPVQQEPVQQEPVQQEPVQQKPIQEEPIQQPEPSNVDPGIGEPTVDEGPVMPD